VTPARQVEVRPSADELARVVADRLLQRLAGLQSQGRVPSLALTGGSIAERVHRAVLADPEHTAVDWSRVELWFGDERFVPADDGDRNALQARAALLDALPVPPGRVHEMPALGGAFGDDVEAAADAYGEEAVRLLGSPPRFDVVMLGIGPDGHCASLFPGHEAVRARGVAVAVRDSPKPPPTRISLTMETLRRAEEVWFLASGDAKAGAVRDALTGDDVDAVPASGPAGTERTVWFLDAAAAARLPDGAMA
jgi:6-phosphogluconolactonase